MPKSRGVVDLFMDLPIAPIANLREHMNGSSLSDEQAQMLRRALALTAKAPPPALALLARRVLGPRATAGAAVLMPVETALEVAASLEGAFLADVVGEIDLDRAEELVGALPRKRAVEIALILFGRGQFETLARFLDMLGEKALLAVLAAIDDEGLLRLFLSTESRRQLAELISLLPRDRLRSVIRTAASGAEEIWLQTLGLVDRLGIPGQKAFAAALGTLGTRLITKALGTGVRAGMWPELTTLVGISGKPVQRDFTKVLSRAGEPAFIDLLRTLAEQQLLPVLMPILLRLDPVALRLLAQAARALPAPITMQLQKELLKSSADQAVAKLRSTLFGK